MYSDGFLFGDVSVCVPVARGIPSMYVCIYIAYENYFVWSREKFLGGHTREL